MFFHFSLHSRGTCASGGFFSIFVFRPTDSSGPAETMERVRRAVSRAFSAVSSRRIFNGLRRKLKVFPWGSTLKQKCQKDAVGLVKLLPTASAKKGVSLDKQGLDNFQNADWENFGGALVKTVQFSPDLRESSFFLHSVLKGCARLTGPPWCATRAIGFALRGKLPSSWCVLLKAGAGPVLCLKRTASTERDLGKVFVGNCLQQPRGTRCLQFTKRKRKSRKERRKKLL